MHLEINALWAKMKYEKCIYKNHIRTHELCKNDIYTNRAWK